MAELCYRNNPKSLFRKYARLVTWFAKTELGRVYLGVPKDIALMLPNGYHRENGGDYRATFYTSAKYAPKLYPALVRVDLVSQWLKDFKEAQHLLAWELGLTRNIPTLAKAVMLASPETFNPDPHVEVTSVDGYVANTQAEDAFLTIRNGAGTASGDSGGYEGTPIFASTATSNKWANWRRSIFLFDTSGLPNSAEISAAVLSVWSDSKVDNFNQGMNIDETNPNSNTALTGTDFGTFTFVAQATAIDIGSIVNSQYNDWIFNATGRGNINTSGISKFGMLATSDLAGVDPGWQNNLSASLNTKFAETADVTSDPKLVVTYTVPEEGGAFLLNMI